MFDIVVTKKDIKAVEKFLEEGILVQEMNKRGLSIGAMALVLTGIEAEIIKARAQLYVEGDTYVLETEETDGRI